jgi:hypothetical protein
MNVKVEVLDTTRRKNAYDGVEPADYSAKIKVPMGRLDYAFSISEIVHQPFSKLKTLLGDPAFDKIVETQGYKIPKGEFGTFVGEDSLSLYFYTRPDDKPDAVKLLLVSWGEYQPGRYIAHCEGIYRITGASF